jgi:hypothetical protein
MFALLSAGGAGAKTAPPASADSPTTTWASSERSGAAITFDDARPGALPEGWRAAATGDGELARWSVVSDPAAPSRPNVLALLASTHGRDQTFNLCVNDTIRFRDGRISVKFKADSGVVDRGGGPVWRVRDARNYYICRANPLESNFRVYKVVDGARKQLAGVTAQVPWGQWLSIDVEHVGDRIVCVLDGKTRIEATDSGLPDEGGVGVWTKADALTRFDDLIVEPARRPDDAPSEAPAGTARVGTTRPVAR